MARIKDTLYSEEYNTYIKGRLIEEREMEMDDAVRFDLEQREALEIFYKDQDAKLRTRKLNRLADLSVLFLVSLASLGAGALLTTYLMEMFYG